MPLTLLLLVLLLPPAALLLRVRWVVFLAGALVVGGWLQAPAAVVLPAVVLAAAFAWVLGEARRVLPAAWLAGAWLLAGLLPLWVPPLAETAWPGAGPPPIAWWFWPPAPLAASWDPARLPPLYESWGSRTPVPAVPTWIPLLATVGAAALLYWRRRSGAGRAGSKGRT